MSLPSPETEDPNCWVAVMPDEIPDNIAARLAESAVAMAMEMVPRVTGVSARRLRAVWGKRWYGIHDVSGNLRYGNRGTRPRVMRELEGKAQPLDEPVLTPCGWRAMGSLSVGDMVIGSDGHPTPVTGVFPQGALDAFRVSFRDGTSTLCSGDHLWAVRRANSGAGRWEVRTTEYLAARPQVSWALPVVQPVQFEGLSTLPLHPYIVGALIGDGYLGGSSPVLSAKEDAVPREVESLLPDGTSIQRLKDNFGWSITAGRRGTLVNPVSRALAEIGLRGTRSATKFLPPTYMAASVEDRLSLLQGLMDADGTTSMDGHLRYSTISEVLAGDVANLVRGLGGVASISNPGRLWTVALRLPVGMSPYRAEQGRKILFDTASTVRRPMSKSIRSIVPVGDPVEMQCISVESEDSLYVTSGYTLTHNTVPMWITDDDGSMTEKVPAHKRGEMTRVTEDGRRQVKIFRKVPPIGSRKTVIRRGQRVSVPRHYPGAPGRINYRTGRFGGVWWRHPGLRPRRYFEDALVMTAEQSAVPLVDVYPTRMRGR